ncbi:hypothetical protein [Serratia quinivorans]|uniref:hypothetical protein n=1 Tax=Serratia quinivorans TaxID=137545 RepID=UPI00107EAF40|nr:hypothetical protein [Serratia quinivorans]QBX68323.1 hypothetical protein E4343_20035 [Serratia quinivorans]
MKARDEIKQKPQRIMGAMNTRVRAQQSNHEGYHLPPCLSHLLAISLYLTIAYLGVLMRAALSRQETPLLPGGQTGKIQKRTRSSNPLSLQTLRSGFLQHSNTNER